MFFITGVSEIPCTGIPFVGYDRCDKAGYGHAQKCPEHKQEEYHCKRAYNGQENQKDHDYNQQYAQRHAGQKYENNISDNLRQQIF